jgi:hypothetical protein
MGISFFGPLSVSAAQQAESQIRIKAYDEYLRTIRNRPQMPTEEMFRGDLTVVKDTPQDNAVKLLPPPHEENK